MLLGKGSQSSVYLLTKNDNKCALKTNPNKREVEFLKSISHINIIKFLQSHPQGILLEACVGDLQHVFDSRVNISHLFDLWVFQLLNALAYLQQNQIIHRDVKLANILLDHQYNVKLNDFGLAIHTYESNIELAGTPNYLAPECLKKDSPPTHKSDIYACGVCCFALLTGVLPFEGNSAKQTLINILKQHFQPNLIPLQYKSLVMSMMQVDPVNRSTANDLINSNYFFALFNPLESMFMTPFIKVLTDNKIAVLKTGDVIIQQPGCAVHVDGSVTLLDPTIVTAFFTDQQLLQFDPLALQDIYLENSNTPQAQTQLSITAKQGLHIAINACHKLMKRFHSVMCQGNSLNELQSTTMESGWRAVLWKNDDFHFRTNTMIIRFVRSSEMIEIYNTFPKICVYHKIVQCSVRGIPNEYKELINLAQLALTKCLNMKMPTIANYQNINNELGMPLYHPSSEYVDGVGWLIQIPNKGQMTVELLSNHGERVRIVDDFVFTWHLNAPILHNEIEQPLSKQLSGLKQLNTMDTCKAYKKSEIPDYVKWFIQKFRQ